MILDYIAAEYFVEVISKRRYFEISFDYVSHLKDIIDKEISLEIQKYLDEKTKDDFLYIFKKFPDIFAIKKYSIGLKEPFLSLHCLSNSSIISKQFHYINSYVESCAIVYFSKILITQGPQHYLTLFNTLTNDHTQKHCSYFLHLSATGALKFFLVHFNYFVVVNKIVYWNMQWTTQSLFGITNQIDIEAMKVFEMSVYFLLTCFKSLHYLELKECLSYVQESTKSILEQVSLVRQRELFECLPAVTMDRFGFLSLNTRDLFLINLSDRVKTVLLIVCIIAFKEKMHIVDLVTQFLKRIPSANTFLNLTLKEKFDFIENYPSYFCISHSGHIKLLPTFFLPAFSISQSSLYESICHHPQSVKKKIQVTVKNTYRDAHFHDSTASNLCNDKSGSKFTNNVEQLQIAESQDEKSSSVSFDKETGKIFKTVSWVSKAFPLERNSSSQVSSFISSPNVVPHERKSSSRVSSFISSPNVVSRKCKSSSQASSATQFISIPNVPCECKSSSPKSSESAFINDSIDIDDYLRDVVVDITFLILSLCEKMPVEKLCSQLYSFKLEGLGSVLFPTYTVTEKLNFFKKLSPHFQISEDGFVYLKEDAKKTFVPKTNMSLSELFKMRNSTSSKLPSMFRSTSESETPTIDSDVIETFSTISHDVGKRKRVSNPNFPAKKMRKCVRITT